MKKKILLAVALLLAGIAQAQTQKGNGILGGDIGINSRFSERLSGQTNQPYKQTDVFVPINIQYGHFVVNNWLIGVRIGATYHYCKGTDANAPSETEHSVKPNNPIGLFVRHYWTVGPLLVFGGAGVEGTFISNVVNLANGPTTTVKTRHTRYEINPTAEVGATYFLSNRLALQGSIRGAGLPIPASNFDLGLVYWTGSTGKGGVNPETSLSATDQGNWVVEGGFEISGASQPYTIDGDLVDNKTKSLSTRISIGRFIASKTLLGVGVGFSNYTTPSPTSTNTYQSYSFNPYVQRYLSNRRLTPFLRATLSYSSSRSTNSERRFNGFGGSVGVGLAYLLTNRFMVETSLANLSYNGSANSEPHDRDYNLNLSSQLGGSLSLRYVIAGR